MQFELTCTVLRAVSNVMHPFACKIRKMCNILRTILEKSVHRFACKLELTCTVLRAVSNVVHHFTCKVIIACIILRAVLKEDVHRFVCKSKVRASFSMQV